jgi:hypothetical protein
VTSNIATTGLRSCTNQPERWVYRVGAVAELIVFDAALGSTERQAVRDYLNDKWGL